MSAKILQSNDLTINLAAKALLSGKLVSFPTETVYGLGADATNDKALAKIFAEKKRPKINPLIVHFSNLQSASEHVKIDERVYKLSDEFWPGPLTIILKKKSNSNISLLASAGLSTLAIRIPNHKTAIKLINEAKTPIAAPSANISGLLSPTKAEHVYEFFKNKNDFLIIDGGASKIGIESTIIDLSNNDTAYILRTGFVTKNQINKKIHINNYYERNIEKPKSPGQFLKHYSPNTPLKLNTNNVAPGDVFLKFGNKVPETNNYSLNLSPSGNLIEAAANLFSMLHILDKVNAKSISVMPIPKKGIGIAINDRLNRAAHK